MLKKTFQSIIPSDFSEEETLGILISQIEKQENFTIDTLGKDETKYFLGRIGDSKFRLKINIFASQKERRRYTLLLTGQIKKENNQTQLSVTYTQFAKVVNVTRMGLGILLFATFMFPFAYDGNNLFQLAGGIVAMLAIMAALIWNANSIFLSSIKKAEEKFKNLFIK